ncbi:MAG: LytTR family transcriptional regulator [Clostridia bacterium]|nr:LytTR family transcriptional regulator [Clostridia bacterium]
MKHTTIIDPHREEEVVIHAKKKTGEIEELERYLDRMSTELVGYGEDGQILPLRPAEIHCFIVEDGKVYALTEKEKLTVRLPLYAIEEMLTEDFVRINQSCLGSIRKIARFDASIGGALMVTFGNGHRDYVSRRQLKNVKERMHIKL